MRWSIVSDDGHREEGVIAFAVGAGSAVPHSVLGAGATLTWNDIVLRTLFYFGLLAGGGAAVFGLLTRNLLGEALRKPLAHLLFFSLLLVFLGGSGIVHSAPPGTRYALVMKIAADDCARGRSRGRARADRAGAASRSRVRLRSCSCSPPPSPVTHSTATSRGSCRSRRTSRTSPRRPSGSAGCSP